MTDINKHPTLRKLYETSLSLERLPASPEQTATAILLADANRAVDALIDSHSAAISAAVQAEREAIIQFAEYAERVAREKSGEHWEGRSCASFAIANFVRSRGPAPAVDARGIVREYVEAHAGLDNEFEIHSEESIAAETRFESAFAALRALVSPTTGEGKDGDANE